MPAKSGKQYKYMQMVAAGKIKNPSLSKEIAKEFIMYGSPKKNEYKKKDDEKEREKNKKALKQISSSYK